MEGFQVQPRDGRGANEGAMVAEWIDSDHRV